MNQTLIPVKTLSDFKKNLTLGRKIHTTHHQAFNGRDEKGVVIYKDEDKGVRSISIVQSNSFALQTPKKEDPNVFVDSWCQYPKASEVKINSDKSITVLDRDYRIHGVEDQNLPLIPILTYTFVD